MSKNVSTVSFCMLLLLLGGLIALRYAPKAVEHNPIIFEDTSFIAGDSPATLDINAALGYNSTEAAITCDGAGNISVAFSIDGTTYSDNKTLKNGETLSVDGLSIDSIKITHITNSAYRVISY